MNIAEKVLQLKQDFDEVYEAGKAAGGGSGDYDQGYEDGKNSVVRLEKYAKTMRFSNLNLFGTKEVEISFEVADEFTEMFFLDWNNNKGCEINTTVEHLTIATKAKVKNIYRMFGNTNATKADMTLKHITFNFDLDIDNANVVNMNNIFQNFKGVEIIDGTPLNVSNTSTFNSAFVNCIALREIRFVENTIKGSISFSYSPDLSPETIQSIIDGLADLTGGTAQTVIWHSEVSSKLSDEQMLEILNKNWDMQ